MSSLGITLLILVFVCIGGVIAYNAWMAWREGRSRDGRLLDSSPASERNRTEPSLDEAGQPLVSGFGSAGPGEPDASFVDPDAAIFAPSQPYFGDGNGTISDDGAQTPAAPAIPPADPPAPAPTAVGPTGSISADGATSPDAAPADDASPAAEQTDPGETPVVADDNSLPAPPEAPEKPGQVLDAGAPSEAAVGEQTGRADSDTTQAPSDGTPAAKRQEQVAASRSSTPAGGSASSQPASAGDDSVAQFDCIARLESDTMLGGARLLELTRKFTRVGTKPVVITARPDAEATLAPAALQNDQQYREIQFALQLVNRRGPLTAVEYAEFSDRAQSIAETLQARVSIPELNRVMEQARSLEAHIGSLDAQVAVNVVTAQALNATSLQAAASQMDLSESASGRYVRLNKEGHQVFSVTLGEQPNRLVLLLDVPRVSRSGWPLRDMVECAWKFAQNFDGRMVDDAGQPIDNALFERIEKQLDTHYQALQAAGVPAGSEQALKIFS